MQSIRQKEMDFLSTEAAGWVEEEIITGEQADAIMSLYEVKPRNLRMVMLSAGLILLGLGGVSFVLAHWHEIDKIIRVGLIAGAYVISLIAYLFTVRKSARAGKCFLLLSSAIFGGGIYLITHMYDIPITLAEFLCYWVIQVIITSVIFRDEWQVYLACALSLIWMNETEAINAFALYFVRTAILPLTEFFTPWSAFALLAALWASYFAVKDRVALMLCVMITVLLLASRMSLCLGGTWTLIILVISGAVMSFLAGNSDCQTLGLLMVGVFGLLLTWPMFWRGGEFESYRNILPVVNAVIVAGLLLANIWRGHSGVGSAFCVILAGRYFFDHLFGFLPKAWGFTAAGIILLVGAIFFGRISRLFTKE